MKWKLACWVLIVSGSFVFSCKDKSTDTIAPQKPVLVSSQIFTSRTASDIRSYLTLAGLSSYVLNDADIYKVTYNTTYKGQAIVASGLVALPNTSNAVPMISFQHGTIVAHSEAPSLQSASSTDMLTYTGLASAGFIAAVPDYIGFGSSSDILHPYFVEEPTAVAVTDMLKAAAELAVKQKVTFNGKLFLAGYSQGGYATMAAHKYIEQKGLSGFTLVASFPAAGAYDVRSLLDYFLGLSTYADPSYVAYIAFAYKNNIDTWIAPLTDFFNEPYGSKIPALFDGTKNGSQIDDQLTTDFHALLQADLVANMGTDQKYTYITDAFTANSLTDWKPMIKMYMYHGDADTTVPYTNSEATYQKLIANGASPNTVTLTKLAGADHTTGVIPYLQDFIPILVSLK